MKKIISVLMAVLLVATCFPLFAVSAEDADTYVPRSERASVNIAPLATYEYPEATVHHTDTCNDAGLTKLNDGIVQTEAVEQWNSNGKLSLVDTPEGYCYLTFSLHDFVKVTGIEVHTAAYNGSSITTPDKWNYSLSADGYTWIGPVSGKYQDGFDASGKDGAVGINKVTFDDATKYKFVRIYGVGEIVWLPISEVRIYADVEVQNLSFARDYTVKTGDRAYAKIYDTRMVDGDAEPHRDAVNGVEKIYCSWTKLNGNPKIRIPYGKDYLVHSVTVSYYVENVASDRVPTGAEIATFADSTDEAVTYIEGVTESWEKEVPRNGTTPTLTTGSAKTKYTVTYDLHGALISGINIELELDGGYTNILEITVMGYEMPVNAAEGAEYTIDSTYTDVNENLDENGVYSNYPDTSGTLFTNGVVNCAAYGKDKTIGIYGKCDATVTVNLGSVKTIESFSLWLGQDYLAGVGIPGYVATTHEETKDDETKVRVFDSANPIENTTPVVLKGSLDGTEGSWFDIGTMDFAELAVNKQAVNNDTVELWRPIDVQYIKLEISRSGHVYIMLSEFQAFEADNYAEFVAIQSQANDNMNFDGQENLLAGKSYEFTGIWDKQYVDGTPQYKYDDNGKVLPAYPDGNATYTLPEGAGKEDYDSNNTVWTGGTELTNGIVCKDYIHYSDAAYVGFYPLKYKSTITFDLGAEKTFNVIRFHTIKDRQPGIQVPTVTYQFSDDGETWVDSAQTPVYYDLQSNEADGYYVNTLILDTPVTYRYIKLTMKEGSATNAFVSEVEAFNIDGYTQSNVTYDFRFISMVDNLDDFTWVGYDITTNIDGKNWYDRQTKEVYSSLNGAVGPVLVAPETDWLYALTLKGIPDTVVCKMTVTPFVKIGEKKYSGKSVVINLDRGKITIPRV